ncbi:acetyl-CoA carboxylase [Rhizobium gallicum]|uniref:acetyl-CoA carboxylase n=1 Tax=Rhizobium gallicum TaxID=56730 RepID=UPI000B68D9CD|nr:acetyl-CoA carboxylase [Rhizobium gallicum]OWK23380.1 acetyl-COA carboxylase [Rhizobium yanglingense]ULJ76284.1 acetyl-CoA carboxylase [Rhizobium gallicum]
MSAIDFSDPATIAVLTDALTAAGVDGLEISRPGGQLRIVVSKEGGAQVARSRNAQPGLMAALSAIVKAPMAGRFCVSHPAAPVDVKQLPHEVSDKDVIGFIRIGSVLLPITAGRSGLLTRLLAERDALVGFGDPLFEIEQQS